MFETGIVSVTVQKFERNTSTELEDEEVAGILVKTCVTGLPDGSELLGFSWEPWGLVGPDSERYPPANWQTIKKPEYPDDDEVGYALGECAKGWILFDTSGAEIAEVTYRNGHGDRATWKVD